MRGARLLLPILAALAVSACARQQPAYYVIDPNTGQPVPVVAQQPLAPPQSMFCTKAVMGAAPNGPLRCPHFDGPRLPASALHKRTLRYV